MHLHGKKIVRWALSTYTAACPLDGWHFAREGQRVVLARRPDETLRTLENMGYNGFRTNGGKMRNYLLAVPSEANRAKVCALKLPRHRSSPSSTQRAVRIPRMQHARADIRNPLWKGHGAKAPNSSRSSCRRNPIKKISLHGADIGGVRTHKQQAPRAGGQVNPLWQKGYHYALWRYFSFNRGSGQNPFQRPKDTVDETNSDIEMGDALSIVFPTGPGGTPEIFDIEPVEVRPRFPIMPPMPTGDEKEISSLAAMMRALVI